MFLNRSLSLLAPLAVALGLAAPAAGIAAMIARARRRLNTPRIALLIPTSSRLIRLPP